MPSKLTLYNGALRMLGQRSLASLAENRESRRNLDESWDDGAQVGILEQGWWKFATRSVQLTFDPSFTRQFGYAYRFTRPDDYTRLAAFSSDQYLRSTIDDYIVEGGAFYCDVNPLWMSYVSKSVDFGLNYSIWPQTFNEYAQGYLAERAAPRFKLSPAEKKDIHDQVVRLKHDALSKDVAEGPVKKMRVGSWGKARMGGGFPLDRLRGGRLIG